MERDPAARGRRCALAARAARVRPRRPVDERRDRRRGAQPDAPARGPADSAHPGVAARGDGVAPGRGGVAAACRARRECHASASLGRAPRQHGGTRRVDYGSAGPPGARTHLAGA
eukprot:4211121-Prymnesium_polylepis.1